MVFPTKGQRPQAPVHLPQPPQPHTVQMSCRPSSAAAPSRPGQTYSLAPTAPQGLGLYPLLGRGVWWGSLELGLSLCTPPQLLWFLRVWGPFWSIWLPAGWVGGVLFGWARALEMSVPFGFVDCLPSPKPEGSSGKVEPQTGVLC